MYENCYFGRILCKSGATSAGRKIFYLGDVTIYEHTPPELVLSRIGDAEIVLLNKYSLQMRSLMPAQTSNT
jgi:hypothetical protein